MLSEEQPHADPSHEKENRQLDEHGPVRANEPPERAPENEDGSVGAEDASARGRPRRRQLDGQPMADEELEDPTESDDDERAAIGTVEQTPPPRRGQVLGHGECIDLADAAAVEVAEVAVMDGVRAPPEFVGSDGEHPEQASDAIVGGAPRQERAVTAVVLDDEETHHESGRRQRETERQPVGAVDEPRHRRPQRQESDHVPRELSHAASNLRLGVAGHHLRPAAPFCLGRDPSLRVRHSLLRSRRHPVLHGSPLYRSQGLPPKSTPTRRIGSRQTHLSRPTFFSSAVKRGSERNGSSSGSIFHHGA